MPESLIDRSRARILKALDYIAENIRKDRRISIPVVAKEVGVSDKTIYRWLESPPQKMDVVQIAALADYLHDEYGHEDFANVWARVCRDIK